MTDLPIDNGIKEQGGKSGQSFEIQDKDKWYGTEIQSDTTQMVDSGTGRPFILRTFEFAKNPKVQMELRDKKIPQPTKQQLFNTHWPQIRTLLWGDGLVANEEVEPRVVIGKKKYRIFILCEPKFGTIVNDKMKTLQEVFNKPK